LADRLPSDEAYSTFYKAIWSAAWQDCGYSSLAQFACTQGNYIEALDLVEHSLTRNTSNYRARHLKAALLRRSGHLEEAEQFVQETGLLDRADFATRNERYTK
jgi:Flp pilus assembly protein TadD